MVAFQINWLEDRSDEGVLAEIRRVAALVPDRRLTVVVFDSHSRIKSAAVSKRFGSWGEATRRAGLTGALPEYTDAAIIDDLRKVAESCTGEAFTSAFYAANGRYSPSCIKRRLGGWRNALDAAGIGSRFVGPATTERMKSQPNRAMTNDEILVKIRDVFTRLGKPTLAGADIEANSEITQNLMYRRFGSVSAALRQAGIEQAAHGRRHTEDEVFENLLGVWTHFGRPPTASEMDSPPSTVGKNTYITRFGGWRNALKAFVARANSELDDRSAQVTDSTSPMLPTPTQELGIPAVGQSATVAVRRPRAVRSAQSSIRPEDRRDPSIGLRFKVLQRDQFRCRLCGRSPATEVGCNLHVDHIVPFSKGGKTTFDNLQALCSHCNVGKSNRSVEPHTPTDTIANPALNLDPFGRWTLRDKAAQRRLAR